MNILSQKFACDFIKGLTNAIAQKNVPLLSLTVRSVRSSLTPDATVHFFKALAVLENLRELSIYETDLLKDDSCAKALGTFISNSK